MVMPPTVVVFSGLPGVGKSTVCRLLVEASGLFYLRVDAIEEPLILADIDITSEGYQIMKNLAQENVDLGIGSVIDCVNPWPETRELFELEGAKIVRVEIYCSDVDEHRRRLKARFQGPSWAQILKRGYVPWDAADFRFDTAVTSADDAVRTMHSKFKKDRSWSGPQNL